MLIDEVSVCTSNPETQKLFKLRLQGAANQKKVKRGEAKLAHFCRL